MYVMCYDIPLHPLTSHLKGSMLWPLHDLRGSSTVGGKKKKRRKPPLAVPQPSLLARHDNTVIPSFFFSRPCQGKALVLLSTAKGEVRPPQDLSFYGDGRKAEGGKNTAEGAQKRKFWRDLSCRFAGVSALLGALPAGLSKKMCALDVLKKEFDLQPCPGSIITSFGGVAFLEGKVKRAGKSVQEKVRRVSWLFVRKP